MINECICEIILAFIYWSVVLRIKTRPSIRTRQTDGRMILRVARRLLDTNNPQVEKIHASCGLPMMSWKLGPGCRLIVM